VELFSRLLMLSEHRGPYATGAVWVKTDGTFRVEKAPLPARRFLQMAKYADFLNDVDDDLTVLMGHTRWPTRGSVDNPDNNHPLLMPIGRQGQLALCHNGHVHEVARHFHRLGLPRKAEVDSELLARLAQGHAGKDGLNLKAFLADLAPLDGRMSITLTLTSQPHEVVLLKGNMPLEVRYHLQRQVLAYASEVIILEQALAGERGWRKVPLLSGEGLMVSTMALTKMRRVRFTFAGMEM